MVSRATYESIFTSVENTTTTTYNGEELDTTTVGTTEIIPLDGEIVVSSGTTITTDATEDAVRRRLESLAGAAVGMAATAAEAAVGMATKLLDDAGASDAYVNI